MSTYTPIATQTLTSNTASIVFAGIPQIYTNLIIIVNAGATANEDLGLRFNNDSSSSYSNNVFAGNGTTVSAGAENNATALACTSNAYIRTSINNIVKIMIGNYTNFANYKSIQITAGLGASGGGAQEIIGGYYRQTTPITSISFFGKNSGYSFLAGSTFSLYGIVSGGGYANGGDIVTTDGTYWYHAFLSSGAFVPTQNLTNVDYLIVAGGGGGAAGGGGAGGLRSTVTATGGGGSLESKLSLTANNTYLVTVGAGGVGRTSYTTGAFAGDQGNYSSFFGSDVAEIKSIGGGGGGSGSGAATNGGSGGGASYSSGQATYGLGTANQGYDGGQDTVDSPPYPAPGGGGAGQVGYNPPNGSNGGNGGNGVQITALANPTSTGANSGYYAGGGGGGVYGAQSTATGGLGGGGNGGINRDAVANTGGGGGGNANAGVGGNGGSGIVIVRYAV